jgi:WD40 repeat protein
MPASTKMSSILLILREGGEKANPYKL